MRPPETFFSAVRVALGVGPGVMHPVLRYPLDGAVLTGQGSAEYDKIGDRFWKFESAMGEIAMKAQTDSDRGGQPMEEKENGHGAP